jgi:hypothetical protein
MGASVAAIIIKQEKDLVEHFRRAGATSPETAQSPAALGVEEGMIWERLVDGAVIRGATGDAYYLDEPSWAALGRRRRRVAIAIMVALIVVGISVYLASAHVVR